MKRVSVKFSPDGWDDYVAWIHEKRLMQDKINALIGAIMREPFVGPGKPERLKGYLSGCWSRRIDEKHRLIYRVTDDGIEVVRCRGHYDDH